MLLVIPASVLAQKSFGLKGGLNLAKFHVSASAYGQSASASSDNLTSFSAGLYFSSKFNENWGFQSEILYSGQGGSANGSGDLNLNYMLFPFMVKYYPAPSVSLQVGPQFGLLMSATAAGQNVISEMNTFDFDVNFGIGVALSDGVELGFRYVLGLTNIIKDTGAGSGISISTTNQVMQFTVAFRLNK